MAEICSFYDVVDVNWDSLPKNCRVVTLIGEREHNFFGTLKDLHSNCGLVKMMMRYKDYYVANDLIHFKICAPKMPPHSSGFGIEATAYMSQRSFCQVLRALTNDSYFEIAKDPSLPLNEMLAALAYLQANHALVKFHATLSRTPRMHGRYYKEYSLFIYLLYLHHRCRKHSSTHLERFPRPRACNRGVIDFVNEWYRSHLSIKPTDFATYLPKGDKGARSAGNLALLRKKIRSSFRRLISSNPTHLPASCIQCRLRVAAVPNRNELRNFSPKLTFLACCGNTFVHKSCIPKFKDKIRYKCPRCSADYCKGTEL